VEVRTGAIVKNSGILLRGRSQIKKTAFFAFCGYPKNAKNAVFIWYPSTILQTAYRKQFYPKPVVPMESRDSEGVPFASLESL